MAIFSKRPLAFGCMLLTLAVILSECISFVAIQVLLCLGILLFAAALFLCLARPRLSAGILLLLAALGLLLGALRVLPIHLRERALHAAEGHEVTAELTVRDVLVNTAYGAEVLADIEKLDGEAVKGRVILRLSDSAPFLVGDKVICIGKVSRLDADNYAENRHITYRARGAAVKLTVTDTDTLTVEKGEVGSFARAVSFLRTRATGRIRACIRGDAGAFAAAILLGERDVLPRNVISDFRYAGVSHLLALSGLHLGILAMLTEKLLLGVGLSRRRRIIALSCLIIGYLALTGFPLSLQRAALMLVLFQLSFLCRTRTDATTSLFLACAVMLIVAPLSFLAASFQMTVLATFGILTVGKLSRVIFRRLHRGRGVWRKLLLWPLSGLLITLAASLFTYPIQWITFGEVSLITPLSNLLLLPLTAPFLYLVTFALCLFPSGVFGKIAGDIGNVILTLVRALGHPRAMLSLRGSYVLPLVFISLICTLLLLCIRLRRKPLVLLPYLLCTLAFFAIGFTRDVALYGKIALLYARDGEAECILLLDGGKTLLVDTTSATSPESYTAHLYEMDRTVLDYYLLTDRHALNAYNIAVISRTLSPRTVLIPYTENEDEAALLAEIARSYGITLVTYPYGTPLHILKNAVITVSGVQGDESVQITGKTESFSYRSGAFVAASDARYQVVAAGNSLPAEPLSLGGADTTLIVADEAVLDGLTLHADGRYLLFPAKQYFLLH